MKKDYRKNNSELRRELFKRYYYWSMRTNDCDPAMFMMNYINKRMELNIEQRYWFAWLYANTYNVATAWILFNEFPDFENVDIDRLTVWSAQNSKQLRYEKDNKWQKGHLPAMFQSYHECVTLVGTQREFFDCFITPNQFTNFNELQDFVVKKFHKFGRYLSWFYLQTLQQTCDLHLQPNNLLLKDSSSESHRTGLIRALGYDYVLEEDSEINPASKEFIALLDNEAGMLLNEITIEFPDITADFFTMETVLCAFKKIFRKKQGRYLGYYIDRQGENILQCQNDGWKGIDWDLMWDARKECLDERLLGNKVEQKRMWEFLDTGNFERFNWYFL